MNEHQQEKKKIVSCPERTTLTALRVVSIFRWENPGEGANIQAVGGNCSNFLKFKTVESFFLAANFSPEGEVNRKKKLSTKTSKLLVYLCVFIGMPCNWGLLFGFWKKKLNLKFIKKI